MLDDELLERARKIAHVVSTSGLLDFSLRELIRRESLRQLADALERGDETISVAPRRRPL